METHSVKAAGLAAISGRRLLVVKKGNWWILPGGKVEEGENCLGCLAREVAEELPGAMIKVEKYYREFRGTTPISRKEIVVRVYLGSISGNFAPAAEITDFCWVDSNSRLNLSDITHDILAALCHDDYIA